MNRFRIHTADIDPFAALALAVDGAFMQLYGHARRNARRIVRLAVALIPLMVLLVGSCKTAGLNMNGEYSRSSNSERIRTALFPDRVNFQGVSYYPAGGYVARAQQYVAEAPGTLSLLNDREIEYLFGRPALTRKDADARVLQYRGEGCVVDFYFYGEKPAAFIDVRLKDAPADQAAREKCIGKVIDHGDFSGSRA